MLSPFIDILYLRIPLKTYRTTLLYMLCFRWKYQNIEVMVFNLK